MSGTTDTPPTKVQKIVTPDTVGDGFRTRDFDVDTQKALEDIDYCQNEIDALNEKANWQHPSLAISAILDEEEEECLHYLSMKASVANLKINYLEGSILYCYCIMTRDKGQLSAWHCVLKQLLITQLSGDPASKSTDIEWKDGMDLTKRAQQQQSLNRKRRRGVTRTFFQWFLDNTDPSADDVAEICVALSLF
ncbi:hypothetical protein KUTeg_020566 [Tegillarca granosa]|uniref:Uncharacterized protein n=1 Tax=Tegillarca granosa TaxID=220873 RepID=A0ABQ9E8A0_TEGGR|nr:hypothetical protein KUTeg_020566 [Tegillarca granosa]